MRKLLTVCLGNYCRSPFAQVALARRGGAAVTVRSAGLIDMWQGGPAHPSMIAAARHLGLDLTAHRARQVTPEMLAWADDILAMDAAVLGALEALSGTDHAHKLRRYLDDRDVPDPMGQDEDTFKACAALIEEGTMRHLRFLT